MSRRLPGGLNHPAYRFLPVALILLAFALRIAGIDQVPPGLSHDEAYNGVAALQVLAGDRPIFFEINKGIEPLIIYLEAVAFAAFGVGPVSQRLVNVGCGLLTVALVYPLSARLFNRRVALLAMAGMAVSFWAIFVSRLTLRAVTLPPLLLLTLYLFWLALEESPRRLRPLGRSLGLFALAGVAAGLTMYTYLSSRFVPLLLIAIFGYQLARRQVTGRHWVGLLLLLLITAVLFAPLGSYYLAHADSFTRRSDQVSNIPYALNGDVGPLLRHTLRTLGMFTFFGDETNRYNLDGRPVFDWLNGLLFYLGLGLTLARLRRPRLAGPAGLLWLWAFFMLLPGFITDDSPHFLRTIGALPAAYIAWALGVEWLSESASQRMSEWQISAKRNNAPARSLPLARSTPYALRPTLSISLLAVLLLFTTSLTIRDYFGRWAGSPGARVIYGADIAEVARYVGATQDRGLVVISAEYYRDLDPFRFKLHFQGQPPFVIWFDGRQTLALPPPQSDLTLRYVFAASAPPAPAWLDFLQPVPAESGPDYTVYRLSTSAANQTVRETIFPASNALNITVNNDLVLAGYQVLGQVVSGGKFQVLLGWQALRTLPPGSDYTFLVRLRDRQESIWAEADGNGYAPADWQPGVQGLQLLTLRLPGDLPPRAYHLTLEVVDRQRGQALPAGPDGQTVVRLADLAGQLASRPRQVELDRLPNPVSDLSAAGTAYGDRPGIVLRGYQVASSTVHHGDTFPLTLHWQVLKQPAGDYRLQASLVAGPERIPVYIWPVFEPVGGEWPTSQWPADYWVQDRFNLPVGPDVPAGQFRLAVSWFDPETGQSLPAGLAPAEAGLDLGPVSIAP